MEGTVKKRTITTRPDGTRIEEIEYEVASQEAPIYIPYVVEHGDSNGGTCHVEEFARANPGRAYFGVCYCPKCSPWYAPGVTVTCLAPQ